jgi:Holliday junction resolvase
MGPEAKFKAKLTKNLKKIGFFVQSVETSTGRGVPDLWVCHRGASMWIECKAPKGNQIELRKEQRTWCINVAINHEIPVVIVAEHQNDKTLTLTPAKKFQESYIIDRKSVGQFETTPDLCKFLYLSLMNWKKLLANSQTSIPPWERLV